MPEGRAHGTILIGIKGDTIVTTLLQEAFAKAAALPTAEQEVLAARLLAELTEEDEFHRAIAAPGERLKDLARQTRVEHHAGNTQRLDQGVDEVFDDLKQRPMNADQLREIFHALVTEWKAGRGHSSKLKDLAMHAAYQRIIGMGESAVPLLLEELETRPDHWAWALRAITGVDPVPDASRGKLQPTAEAWIKWGRENGYEW